MAKNPIFQEYLGISLIFRIYLGKRHSISTNYIILAFRHSPFVISHLLISRYLPFKWERTTLRLVPTNVLCLILNYFSRTRTLIATTKKRSPFFQEHQAAAATNNTHPVPPVLTYHHHFSLAYRCHRCHHGPSYLPSQIDICGVCASRLSSTSLRWLWSRRSTSRYTTSCTESR